MPGCPLSLNVKSRGLRPITGLPDLSLTSTSSRIIPWVGSGIGSCSSSVESGNDSWLCCAGGEAEAHKRSTTQISDIPANGIKIPRPLSRKSSLPNRDHFTPQIAVAPAERGQAFTDRQTHRPTCTTRCVCVRQGPGATAPLQSIDPPNLIQPPFLQSRILSYFPDSCLVDR